MSRRSAIFIDNLPNRRFWLEWLGVYLFCATLCAYFQFSTPFLPETDGYFHIKAALLMRQRGLFLDGFPWAAFSLWRDGYSDGCLLFHLLLIPFTYGDLVFGAKLAAVLLSAFAFSSFFAILSLNRVRGRFYWFWLLLLGGAFFWWRLLVPRPQIVSVPFLLWSLHFLLNGRVRPFAALSFLYPFAHVAGFLPQVFAFLRWAYLKTVERRSEHKILLAGLAAYALATVVHPYFPKNLRFLYVQDIWVMFFALTLKVDLLLGGEFLPMDTRQFLGAHLPVLAHLFVLGFAAMHRRTAFSERTRVLVPIAAALGLLTMGSRRFVEYSVPAATLLCAFAADDLFAGGALFRGVAAGWKAAWLLFMAAASGLGAGVTRGLFVKVQPPQAEEMARALREKAPPGEVIFTCDWDETPELFFFDDRHRYLVMMDPTFMYYWDPAAWRLWQDVAQARLSADEVHAALTERFKTRFGVCSQRSAPFRRLIGSDGRFKILAETPRSFAFEVR